jgi:hypothetical protein
MEFCQFSNVSPKHIRLDVLPLISYNGQFSSPIEVLGHMVLFFYFIMETLLALELMFVCFHDE